MEELARHALVIERHYQQADGYRMGQGWRRTASSISCKRGLRRCRPLAGVDTLRRYRLKGKSEILVSGRAIGQKIGSGPVRLILDAREMSRVQEGDVLVTDMTDPDWEPVMKRAAGHCDQSRRPDLPCCNRCA